MHSVFQSLRDFKPLFAGAAYNYGAFGGHVADDSSAAYAFPVFLGWGARDTGPSTGTKYAEEVFVACGGNGAAVTEPKTPGILTQGSRGHTGAPSQRRVPAARRFEWFRGTHLFVIEHGTTVADRLALFWREEGQLLRWRDAQPDDVRELTAMIEKNYKLGDEFFVDYDKVGASGGPMAGTKYTRTSLSQIQDAIKGSSASFVRGAGEGDAQRSRFLVGIGKGRGAGAGAILACVQVHACAVPRQAEVSFLTVDGSVGKRGVARECMRIAERTAASLGFSSMAVDVVSTKPWLVEYYERMGFHKTGGCSPWPGVLVEFLRPGFEEMNFVRLEKEM